MTQKTAGFLANSADGVAFVSWTFDRRKKINLYEKIRRKSAKNMGRFCLKLVTNRLLTSFGCMEGVLWWDFFDNGWQQRLRENLSIGINSLHSIAERHLLFALRQVEKSAWNQTKNNFQMRPFSDQNPLIKQALKFAVIFQNSLLSPSNDIFTYPDFLALPYNY